MGTKLDQHVRWHHWAHLVFAVANLVVLGWSCYHLARHDGFGFYDYSDDGKGTYNPAKIWNTETVPVDGQNVPHWIDRVMKDMCPSLQDNYATQYNADGWKWNSFKQEIEAMRQYNKIHLDFGNPVDRIVVNSHKDHFPVCAKGVTDEAYHESYFAICTELGYVGDGDKSMPHHNATHARNTLIAMAVLSAVFFIFQAYHLYRDIKAHGMGSFKFYRHRHGIPTGDDPIPLFAWITWIGHFVMYGGAAAISSLFLAFMIEEEKGDPGFDFTAYHEYTKDGCHVSPYAPTLKYITEKMKKNNPDGTEEYRVSVAIVSIYLFMSVIMALLYGYYLKAMTKDTFIHDDILDKVEEDIEQSQQGSSSDDDFLDDTRNTPWDKRIGSSIAGTLFRRGKKLVELKF